MPVKECIRIILRLRKIGLNDDLIVALIMGAYLEEDDDGSTDQAKSDS